MSKIHEKHTHCVLLCVKMEEVKKSGSFAESPRISRKPREFVRYPRARGKSAKASRVDERKSCFVWVCIGQQTGIKNQRI